MDKCHFISNVEMQDYETVEELGSGSESNVDLIQLKDGRQFAIKFLLKRYFDLREANYLSLFRNVPGIVQLKGICYHSSYEYPSSTMTVLLEPMEYTLYGFRYKNYQTRNQYVPELFFSMLRIFSLFETLQISHGDVHDGNILVNIVDNKKEFKLIDFETSTFLYAESKILEDGMNLARTIINYILPDGERIESTYPNKLSLLQLNIDPKIVEALVMLFNKSKITDVLSLFNEKIDVTFVATFYPEEVNRTIHEGIFNFLIEQSDNEIVAIISMEIFTKILGNIYAEPIILALACIFISKNYHDMYADLNWFFTENKLLLSISETQFKDLVIDILITIDYIVYNLNLNYVWPRIKDISLEQLSTINEIEFIKPVKEWVNKL